MIQIPDEVMKELLDALSETIEVLGTSCEDCDERGTFSFARGRLYALKNIIEEQAKEVVPK